MWSAKNDLDFWASGKNAVQHMPCLGGNLHSFISKESFAAFVAVDFAYSMHSVVGRACIACMLAGWWERACDVQERCSNSRSLSYDSVSPSRTVLDKA